MIVAGDTWLTFPACDPRFEMSLPNVGRSDAIPQNAAGHLNEPPMSFPMHRIDPPAPIRDPLPPELASRGKIMPYVNRFAISEIAHLWPFLNPWSDLD